MKWTFDIDPLFRIEVTIIFLGLIAFVFFDYFHHDHCLLYHVTDFGNTSSHKATHTPQHNPNKFFFNFLGENQLFVPAIFTN